MGSRTCMLAALSIALFCGNGMATLYDCTTDSHAGCVANELGSALCTTNACVCAPNLYAPVTDKCVGKICTLGTHDPETACGGDTNAACSSENKCLCQANFVITRDADGTSQSCAQKECAAVSATTDCTEDNSYCDTGPTQPLCKCKINFAAANLEKCTRVACSTSSSCGESNTYCETGTDAGCNCIGTYSADATTGACTIISCAESATSASITTTCGANTVCEAKGSTYQCFCKAGYTSTGSATCVQTPCTTGTLADTCGDAVAYQCTDLKCACATTYKESGSRCKKECTATSDCDDNAACVNSICECNVNYQGNGNSCTQLPCSGTDVTACHPNSRCSSSKCACAFGFFANGTSCMSGCVANSDCNPNAICESGECKCKATFTGDGATNCAAIECTDKADCTLDNSSCNTTSEACECSSGYEPSNSTVACVETTTNATTNATTTAGAGAVAFSFSFMAASFLMAIFFTKM